MTPHKLSPTADPTGSAAQEYKPAEALSAAEVCNRTPVRIDRVNTFRICRLLDQEMLEEQNRQASKSTLEA